MPQPQTQAPEKQGNNTEQKTDEELLALPEQMYGSLSDDEINRLEALQSAGGEKPPATPEDEKPAEKKEEDEEDALSKLMKGEKKEEPQGKEEEDSITKEELIKKKGWNSETADSVMTKSYVHMEKRASRAEQELAQLKEKLNTKTIEDEVRKQTEILRKEQNKEPTADEIKQKVLETSSGWHEALNDPAQTLDVLNNVIGVAVESAVKKIRDQELKPILEEREANKAKQLKEMVTNEYESVIGTIANQVFSGDKAQAQILFDRLKPSIDEKFQEYEKLFIDGKMVTNMKEAPGALRMIVGEIILERGLFPKKQAKIPLDTGDGKGKGQEQTVITSEQAARMTPEEIAKLTPEQLDKGIEAERRKQRLHR